jgi:DNA-directed RNA polymerase subunit K/omega
MSRKKCRDIYGLINSNRRQDAMTRPPLNDLLFLSNDELVDRLARSHHDAINDPSVLATNSKALSAAKRDLPSWKEILEADYRALKMVSREIALARTTAQSAAATLRQTTYAQALKDTVATVLRRAQQLLAHGPELIVDDRYMGLIAYGHLNLGEAFERIPTMHWKAGAMDWRRRQLRVQEDEIWSGIKVLDLSDLPPEEATAIIENQVADHRPNVSRSELFKCLSDYFGSLDPEEPVSQGHLLTAALRQFPNNKVPRQMVRDWIVSKLPEDRKMKRGRGKASAT